MPSDLLLDFLTQFSALSDGSGGGGEPEVKDLICHNWLKATRIILLSS